MPRRRDPRWYPWRRYLPPATSTGRRACALCEDPILPGDAYIRGTCAHAAHQRCLKMLYFDGGLPDLPVFGPPPEPELVREAMWGD